MNEIDEPLVMNASERDAFDAHRRERSYDAARLVIPVLVALMALGQLTDQRVYPASEAIRHSLAIWRVFLVGALLLVLGATRFSRALRFRTPEIVAVSSTLAMAYSAHVAATLGTGTRFLAGCYLAPFISFVVISELRTRVAYVAVMTSSILVAGFVTNPSLPPFGTWTALMVASSVLAIAGGHILFFLLRQNFLQRRALERTAVELEERVIVRTNDLRALAQRLANVLEQERNRIARDIHDDLGQTLTAMRLEIDHASHDAEVSARLADSLSRISSLVLRTITSSRRILDELRPQGLDELGLPAAIVRLAKDFETHGGCPCEVSIDDDFSTDPERATAIFRVIQESLTNVRKHAHARGVEITLTTDDGLIRLAVRDDGRGLSEGPTRLGALGLVSMKERVWQFGGEVTVSGEKDQGTTVDVEIPARDPQSEREARS